jgi:perosamine synthetase
LIEDAAEMIGHEIKGKPCGFYGHISTFSFYANKHITTGEGGAILTNSSKLHNKINSLRNLCFGTINRYNHSDIGWNYRFTNIQAALGLSQIKRIKWIIKRKISVGKQYYKYLKNNNNIYIQKPKFDNITNVYWVVGILIKNKKILAQKLQKKLKKNGIETRSFFWPMNKQIIAKKFKLNFKKKYPNSEYLSKYGFYLPSGLNIKNTQIKLICKKLNKLI